MRHQERIYIQNANSCIRNKDHINFNMSSDICIFNSPTFYVVGAGKIESPIYVSDDLVHIITTQSNVGLTFVFDSNVETFTSLNATFKYKIFKFNNNTNIFPSQPIYELSNINYSTFIGTSAFTNNIPVTTLIPDGEYLIKGSYDYVYCTEMMGRLGVTNNTGVPIIGNEYGIYDSEFDYYFTAINKADTPTFTLSVIDSSSLGALIVESYELSGETTVEVSNTWLGNIIVALNGLTLSHDDDFTTLNKTIYLNGATFVGDILTVAYVNSGNPNGLTSESIIVDNVIASGVTDGEGSNLIYYNTDISRYEIYVTSDPYIFNDVIVTLNGVTLANVLDYYQSTTNPRRIVLKGVIYSSGDLGDGNIGALADIITIVYNTNVSFLGVIQNPIFDLNWVITNPPLNTNGEFITLFAEDSSFNTIIYSANTQYVANQVSYTSNVNLTGYSGATAYYKIVNNKNYTLISGDVISTFSDSEIIPIEVNI